VKSVTGPSRDHVLRTLLLEHFRLILPKGEDVPEFAPSTTKGLEWISGDYWNDNEDNFTHNTYTAKEWDIMEKAGAIFLPAAGERYNEKVSNVNAEGCYWLSDVQGSEQVQAYALCFYKSALTPDFFNGFLMGYSVRLIR